LFQSGLELAQKGSASFIQLCLTRDSITSRMNEYKNRPWGKHTPPGDEEYRLTHKSKKDADVDATMILPAVTVRDPYFWMQVRVPVSHDAFK
jgi:arginine/ornithine N-succinyltransferase beta subunit